MIQIIVFLAAIIYFIVAWRNLRLGIFLVTALLPTYLVRFSIGPFPSTLLEVLIIITVAVWLINYKKYLRQCHMSSSGLTRGSTMDSRFRGNDRKILPWRFGIAFFIAAGILAVIIAPEKLAALGLFRAYLIEPILFFFVCLTVLENRRDVKKIFLFLSFSALVLGAYAIIQKITGFGIPAPWNVLRRVTSFYPFPNALGLFIGPLIPVFFSELLNAIKYSSSEAKRSREVLKISYWMLVLIVCFLTIIFAQSIGALTGAAAGLVVFGFVWRPRLTFKIIFLAAALFVLAAPPQFMQIVEDKFSFKTWSGKVRIMQWTETVAMLRDHSFFGTGLAGYPSALKPYHKATYIEIFQYPHNIILNFWSEMGLLGLISFIYILLVFFNLIRNIHKRSSDTTSYQLQATTYLGLACSIIALLVHGLVDVPYFKNDLAVEFWILMAAATIYKFE